MKPSRREISKRIVAAAVKRAQRKVASAAYRGKADPGGPNGVAKRAFDFADAYGEMSDAYKEVARQMLDEDYEFLTPAVLDTIEEAIGGHFSWVDSAIRDARDYLATQSRTRRR